MIKWLSPVDPGENHEAAASAHQKGTNGWFFESIEFRTWINSKQPSLWISGFGKYSALNCIGVLDD